MALFGGGDGGMLSGIKGPKGRPPFEAFYIYILALLTGYFLADLAILGVRPGMLPTQTPPNRPRQIKNQDQYTSVEQYAGIKKRNMFNRDGKIAPALTAGNGGPGEIDAPPVASQLPLKVEGTLVHLNPKRSVATISSKNKNEAKAYMVDMEIDGLAKITKIERRKVIFRNLNTQRLEFIEIPKDSAVSFGVKNPVTTDEVQHTGEFEATMKRSDINKYTADLGSVLQQARMVPNIVPGSGGRVDGFRFVAIQPGSIFEKLGFKPMDVIKSVNGTDVSSPTQAMEMYNSLKNDSSIQLGFERNGRQETMKYNISE